MTHVLFVCLGNICRSPMAEGIFNAITDESIHVDSAATSSWEHGNPVHKGTRRILDKHNIDHKHMVSRQITLQDFKKFDYIIGMDRENVKNIMDIAPKDQRHKIHLFLDVVAGKEGMDVPDPWYTGDFEETERLILEGSKVWYEIIKLDQE